MPWTVAYWNRDDPDNTTFSGSPAGEFAPENLQFTLNKAENDVSEFSCEVSRSRSIIGPDFIGPYRHCFRLYNSVDFSSSFTDDCILSGPITMLQVNSREEHAKIAGKSWEHLLEMLFWPFDPSDPEAYRLGVPTTTAFNPPGEFAYQNFAATSFVLTHLHDQIMGQTHSPYITLNIINVQNVDQLLEVQLIDTESYYSKLQTLSQRDDDGFWFRVHPIDRSIDIINQGASGNLYSTSFVLADPDNCEWHFDSDVESSGIYDISYTNTGPACTWLLGTGNNTSRDMTSRKQYVAGQVVYGLLQQIKNYSDVKSQAVLDTLARRDLLFNVNPVHEVSMTVIPDNIPDFWQRIYPGVAIWITADLEAHVLNSAHEVISMDVGVTNQDNALVTMKCNKIYSNVSIGS